MRKRVDIIEANEGTAIEKAIADYLLDSDLIKYADESFDHEFGMEYRGHYYLDPGYVDVNISKPPIMIGFGRNGEEFKDILIPVVADYRIGGLPFRRGSTQNMLFKIELHGVYREESPSGPKYIATYYYY